jgi:hypothetical protein
MKQLWTAATELVEKFFGRDMPDSILKVTTWWINRIEPANNLTE